VFVIGRGHTPEAHLAGTLLEDVIVRAALSVERPCADLMDFDERFAQLLAVAMVCTAQAVQAIAGLLTLFFIFFNFRGLLRGPGLRRFVGIVALTSC